MPDRLTPDSELLTTNWTTSTMQDKLQQIRLGPNLSSLLSELDSALATNGPTSSLQNQDGSGGGGGGGGGGLSDVTQAAVSRDSTVNVALAVLTVFVVAPLIICSNVLLLAAFRRSKRLRTPSNCLVASLAFADLTVGLFLPLGVYFELARPGVRSALLCLLPYCVALVLCGVSMLSMTAIALDRYTSLARPLRYNNIITKATIGRYVAAFWLYSLVIGSTPLLAYFYYYSGSEHYMQQMSTHFTCSYYVIGAEVRVFLFCAMFAPCALVILFCYVYVYIVARYHAHAIYSVELSMRQNSDYRSTNSEANKTPQPSPSPRPNQKQKHQHNHQSHHHHQHQQQQNSFHPRYGRTLAWTVGLFLVLWSPVQVSTLVDALWAERAGTSADSVRRRNQDYIHWLAVLAFMNSALNPWVYGYRNTEFRLAYRRILENLFVKLGVVVKREKHSEYHQGELERVVINGDISGLHTPCCHSNVRLCVSPNHLTMTTLLKPCVYVQHQLPSTTTVDTNSIGCTITKSQDGGTVIICETIITTTEVQ